MIDLTKATELVIPETKEDAKKEHPTLRLASLNDVPAIMVIGQDLFSGSSVDSHKLNLVKIRKNLEAAIVDQNNWLVLLSYEGSRVVGALVAHCFSPLYSDDKIACEVLWHLLPEFRKGRRGLDMMRGFEYWAKEMGCSKCQYGWLATSPSRMEELYHKRGMELVEKVYYKEL